MLVVALLFIQSCFLEASDVVRPRGVSLSKVSFYPPGKDFTCFDGSLTIPFTLINDDYCDCADGSDEPGTAACPNGTFHCTNAGHRPLNLPSSRVNDGICDCCDTSDEYNSKASCQNNCNELGKAARIEAQKTAELTKQGSELRQQLSKKGKQLLLEKQLRLEKLEKDQEEAEKLKHEKEGLKLQAEELENGALEKYRQIEEEIKKKQQEEEKARNEQESFEYFNNLDSNNDGKIELAELQTRVLFDQNKDGVVSEEEGKFFLDNKDEMDWDEFILSGWSRMKPFIMMNSGMFVPPTAQAPSEDESTPEGEEFLEGDEDEEKQQYEEQEEQPYEGEEEEEGEVEEVDEKTDTQVPKPIYDGETQQLIDEASKAREEFEEADRSVRDVQREIKQLKETFEKDFGPEEEFAPLDGECFEYSDLEYIYKLCPFDQASQRPKNGGAETRLGSWNSWIGRSGNKYSAMLYDRGQSCWNGPQRSVHVKLSCGTDNSLMSVSEPNRCEYLFEFVTPAVCQVDENHVDPGHDEL